MARLRLLTPDELSEDDRELIMPSNPFSTSSSNTSDPSWDELRNTHRVLAHNVAMLEAHRRIGGSFAEDTGLTPRKRELVILGVARALDSEYEWHQHVPIALETGLTEDEIRWISRSEFARFESPEAELLKYVEAIVDRSVDDTLHQRLSAHFGESATVGVLMLSGYYIGLDHWASAINLDLEEPFVGWELERLDD